MNDGDFEGTIAIDIDGDGSLTYAVTATKILGASCSGMEVTSGFSWSAAGDTLTAAGTATCTGSFTCGTLSDACTASTTPTAGSCTYALSNSNDTLVLSSCTTSTYATGTFSRE